MQWCGVSLEHCIRIVEQTTGSSKGPLESEG
jgi:hypothetical protein